jgi:hypothetical protein
MLLLHDGNFQDSIAGRWPCNIGALPEVPGDG